MKIAVIADIHGNHLALEAVLSDIKKQNIKTIINLGDHFSGPLEAAKTADILLDQQIITINGNHDRWLLTSDPANMGSSDKEAHSQLSPKHLAWLEKHPATATIFDEIFLCHGTPKSDTAYLLEKVSETGAVQRAPKAEITQKIANHNHPVILCGHTHIPRSIRIDHQLVINPGSVGCPAYTDANPAPHTMQTGTPDACYAILENSKENWSTQFRYIPYDHHKMAELAKQRQRNDWVEALKTGWIS